MTDRADEDVYWDVVKDCLSEIYGLRPSQAVARSRRLRATLARSRSPQPRNLFYHAEPIDVAADLANRQRELSDVDWKKYDAILARHQW